MNKIKCRKEMGSEGLSVEVWKVMGRNGVMWLVRLFSPIMSAGKIPDV